MERIIRYADFLRFSSNSINPCAVTKGTKHQKTAHMANCANLQDQWKRKKQTKAEAKAARKAKLDPDSELHKTAKEIMDERAKNKRKAKELEQNDQEEGVNEAFEPMEGVEAEQPGQGLKKHIAEANKKQKRDEDNSDWEDEEEEAETTTTETNGTVTAKQAKKLEKLAAKKEKRKEKKAEKKAKTPVEPTPATEETTEDQKSIPKSKKAEKKTKKQAAPPPEPKSEAKEEEDAVIEDEADAELNSADFSGLQNEVDTSNEPESEPQSPTFDGSGLNDAPVDPISTSTSISSTVPPSEKPKHIRIPADTSALKARLEAKIAALRAARKADGPDGKPIRTRQELIESRRFKEAQRKKHKQELRTKAKLEEDLKREQALASNSPSVMSPAVELDEANFAFGRVAFGDGAKLSHDLSYVLADGKRKGPSDAKTALLKVQNQKKRLEELDPEKRKDIAEKEAWLTARRRAEGEKIRDNEAILKKTVKRKEVAKKKSEKAWQDRSQGVKHAQKQKQQKREANLKERRENKMLGKAGKKKLAKANAASVKKKGRPGFEGAGLGGKGRK